jgi:hypothetical protein
MLARVLQMTQLEVGKAEYYPDLVLKVQERYQFAIVPKSEDLVPSDPPKGAEFKIGKLVVEGRTIVVNVFTVFADGLVVDLATSTDDADAFLSDVIEWAKEAAPNITPRGPRFYLSQLEIQTASSLEEHLPLFTPLGTKLSALLSTYGISAPTYQPSYIALHFDQAGLPIPQPGAFSLERRAGASYEDNIWFAQAPLKTRDHVALLKQIDNL